MYIGLWLLNQFEGPVTSPCCKAFDFARGSHTTRTLRRPASSSRCQWMHGRRCPPRGSPGAPDHRFPRCVWVHGSYEASGFSWRPLRRHVATRCRFEGSRCLSDTPTCATAGFVFVPDPRLMRTVERTPIRESNVRSAAQRRCLRSLGRHETLRGTTSPLPQFIQSHPESVDVSPVPAKFWD